MFSQNRTLEKKMDLIMPITFVITPINEWCYRVIDSSILQEYCSSVLKCSWCNEEKKLELSYDNKKEWI